MEDESPDVLRVPALIYLFGVLLIIGLSYLLPHNYEVAGVVAVAVWGIGVPIAIFFHVRRKKK